MSGSAMQDLEPRVWVVVGERASDVAWPGLRALAGALGARLEVALISSAGPDTASAADVRLAELERRLSAPSGTPQGKVHLLPSRVALVQGVAKLVGAQPTTLIVLLGVDQDGEAAAKHVAHAWQLPVLVARSLPLSFRTVLVATSFTDEDLPLVRMATRLSAALNCRLVIAHAATDARADDPSSAQATRHWLSNQPAIRAAAARISVEVVVTRGQSPAEALLALARAPEQLIVLGSYPRSWLTAWLIPSVCEAVLADTSGNILIVPLAPVDAAVEPP